MSKNEAKDLFRLQTELVDVKVEMAVNKSIDRVLAGIADLKGDIHQLEGQFKSVECRLASTETNLSSLKSIIDKVHTQFIELLFRAAWGVGTVAVVYLASALYHTFIK